MTHRDGGCQQRQPRGPLWPRGEHSVQRFWALTLRPTRRRLALLQPQRGPNAHFSQPLGKKTQARLSGRRDQKPATKEPALSSTHLRVMPSSGAASCASHPMRASDAHTEAATASAAAKRPYKCPISVTWTPLQQCMHPGACPRQGSTQTIRRRLTTEAKGPAIAISPPPGTHPRARAAPPNAWRAPCCRLRWPRCSPLALCPTHRVAAAPDTPRFRHPALPRRAVLSGLTWRPSHSSLVVTHGAEAAAAPA